LYISLAQPPAGTPQVRGSKPILVLHQIEIGAIPRLCVSGIIHRRQDNLSMKINPHCKPSLIESRFEVRKKANIHIGHPVDQSP
jgi:hypothetical protein